MKLDCPACGHNQEPAHVLYDDIVIVTIGDDREEFDAIAAKIGEDWFKIPSCIDWENCRVATVARFKEYLLEQTDLLVEHDKAHHDALKVWTW